MSEKTLPIVHLPWSAWQDITARLDALEAAVFKSPPKDQQSAAPPQPADAQEPDVIERIDIETVLLHIEIVLRAAREALLEGVRDEAMLHIDEALRLLDDAP